jgi:opacity protein-like surface antigen
MTSRFRRLPHWIAVALSAMLMANAPLSAQPAQDENPVAAAFVKYHQLGGRIGGWANKGTLPPDRIDIGGGGEYSTEMGDANFYLEGFFGYRLNRSFMLELSLGMVTRGDVTLIEPDSGGSSIGTVQLYPILAKLKFYPFSGLKGKLFPYVLAGGGFCYGRHDIQFTNGIAAYYRAEFGSDSETDFTYVLGGGFDWPLASVVGLDLNVQYMPVNFSGNLIGARDYSSLTIALGVKYLMSSLESKKDPYRPLSRR